MTISFTRSFHDNPSPRPIAAYGLRLCWNNAMDETFLEPTPEQVPAPHHRRFWNHTRDCDGNRSVHTIFVEYKLDMEALRLKTK